jgi:hypothetical protein
MKLIKVIKGYNKVIRFLEFRCIKTNECLGEHRPHPYGYAPTLPIFRYEQKQIIAVEVDDNQYEVYEL